MSNSKNKTSTLNVLQKTVLLNNFERNNTMQNLVKYIIFNLEVKGATILDFILKVWFTP